MTKETVIYKKQLNSLPIRDIIEKNDDGEMISMEYSSYPHILSDREQKEWIGGCPVQVKRVKLSVPSAERGAVLSAVITPCGGFSVESVTAELKLTDARHKPVLTVPNAVFRMGESEASFDGVIPENAVFGSVTVQSVKLADGREWVNADGTKGSALPEQKIIWQTDPLYEAIRFVCGGVVDAKYFPDQPADGAWRCACGQVNLKTGEDDTCGACGCGRGWLESHFDEAYLQEQLKELQNKKADPVKKKAKKQKNGISDKAKFILILASAAVVITGAVLTPTIGKAVRYSKAEGYFEAGDYDRAIEEFTKLEGFSDANARLQEANYKKAQVMTGIEDVNMVWSSRYPCYSITEDGVLSFRMDEYKGDWEHFVVPDVVDGVVVKELDKNFFLNCKSMKEVTISDCVEVLGEGTFFNCESLTTVYFGKNVRSVGARCFINCTALETVTIPDTVEKIGLRAFNSCTALKEVTLGSGITTIPSYLFSFCLRLETVTLRSPVTSVGEYAFADCASFKELRYPGTEAMWNEVRVSGNNDILLKAKITFME